jgi:hypothetical protein
MDTLWIQKTSKTSKTSKLYFLVKNVTINALRNIILIDMWEPINTFGYILDTKWIQKRSKTSKFQKMVTKNLYVNVERNTNTVRDYQNTKEFVNHTIIRVKKNRLTKN